MVARLVAEASRVASRAVVLFDLCRSALASLFLSVVGTLRFRDAVLVRDGIASYRRAYTPAELGLLARLGAPDADARISFEPPAHAQVVLRVD
jgi:hypothetical protein